MSPFVVFAACNAGNTNTKFSDDDDGVGATGNPTGTGAQGAGSTGTGGDMGFDAGNDDGGLPPVDCESGPDEDKDGDGWTVAQGDCNDCDPNVNPNAVEVIAVPDADGGVPPAADENCNGQIDEAPTTCDSNIALAVPDPLDGARAIELCKMSTGPKDWGVVGAAWVLPDGSAANGSAKFHLGHGALTGFGPNVHVQAGSKMLALSSGTARQPTDTGYSDVGGYDKGYTCGSPQGFPKESPACPGVTTGQPHDGIALEVTIRPPSNAKGFSFDFDFYTYEWPGYICSKYNDIFVALLSPIPQGQTDGNISFDSQGNPVTVNNAFLDVCGCAGSGGPPCSAGGKSFPCSLGDSQLTGTGFQDMFGTDHGATGWLFTQAPIVGDTIVMRWGIYDSGDGVLDSTVLIDNWKWIASPGTQVGTGHVPTPR